MTLCLPVLQKSWAMNLSGGNEISDTAGHVFSDEAASFFHLPKQTPQLESRCNELVGDFCRSH